MAPLGATNDAVKLAQDLFGQYRGRCFWHSPDALVITEDLIPFVILGLRKNGGHEGYKLAGMLRRKYDKAKEMN